MQVFGTIICALVAIRLLQSIIASVQSAAVREATVAQELALLDEQIAATKALRVQRENEHLHWNGYRKFRVGKKVEEARGTVSLYLLPHDKKPLPVFRPGQYLTFRFQLSSADSGELKSAVRCYSLSDSPHEDYFRITVKRVPSSDPENHPAGLISNHIHDEVHVGDIIDVQAPRGDFFLEPHGTKPVVLIGGGVGLTPMLSMLNAIVRSGATRDVWLFVAVRNRAEHMMRDHLRRIADRCPNVHLTVCYSAPEVDCKHGVDYDHSGHLTVDVIRERLAVPNFDFYVCGPPPMMESLIPSLESWGVTSSRIHTEAFGPATAKKTVPPKKNGVAPGKAAINVQFARTGKTLAWDGSAANLLDLALDNGIPIDSGCRAGSCGTCLVAVREGNIEANVDANCREGSCLMCVSVPAENVILDA